jgi:hypothetical protein
MRTETEIRDDMARLQEDDLRLRKESHRLRETDAPRDEREAVALRIGALGVRGAELSIEFGKQQRLGTEARAVTDGTESAAPNLVAAIADELARRQTEAVAAQVEAERQAAERQETARRRAIVDRLAGRAG